MLTIVAASLDARPLVVAVDLSYSLQLPADGGSSRGEVLLRHTLTWLSEQPADTEYALVVCEHAGVTNLILGYPSSRAALEAELPTLVPFGTTDLDSLISTASAIARSIDDEAGILLVTDGEIAGTLDPSVTATLIDSDVTLSAVLYDSGLPTCAAAAIERLAGESGGVFDTTGPGTDVLDRHAR